MKSPDSGLRSFPTIINHEVGSFSFDLKRKLALNSVGYLFFGKVIALFESFSLECLGHPYDDHPGKLTLLTYFIKERYIVESERFAILFQIVDRFVEGFCNCGVGQGVELLPRVGIAKDTVSQSLSVDTAFLVENVAERRRKLLGER